MAAAARSMIEFQGVYLLSLIHISLRGFMIDCGRKFIPMAYLQDLVKIMAYYKMNTLQVHLNDNGFKQRCV